MTYTGMQENMLRIIRIVGLILLVLIFGSLFVEGWNWGIGDFLFAFVLLFVTGLAIDWAMRKFDNLVPRMIASAAIVLVFLITWVELATGGISRAIAVFF